MAFVEAEIQGINHQQEPLLKGRLPLPFTQLSLDVGAISRPVAPHQSLSTSCLVPSSPWNQHWRCWCQDGNSSESFHVMGSGLAGVEVALALRQRWPRRPIHLLARMDRLDRRLAKALREADVHIEHQTADAPASRPLATISAGLLCSGSRAPSWLVASGLPCCSQSGRVRTNNKLQVIDQPQIFASGDCGVIDTCPRSPSGVWAVRAAIPLARNLEAASKNKPLRPWAPQQQVLQLLGGFKTGHPMAWAIWDPFSRPPPAALALETKYRPTFHAAPSAFCHEHNKGDRR